MISPQHSILRWLSEFVLPAGFDLLLAMTSVACKFRMLDHVRFLKAILNLEIQHTQQHAWKALKLYHWTNGGLPLPHQIGVAPLLCFLQRPGKLQQ